MALSIDKGIRDLCTSSETTHGVRVTAQSFYVPQSSKLDAMHYFFAYEITISNESVQPVKLLRRFWQIMDGTGRLQVVQGEGVVGEQPTIEPGQRHTYRSFCPLPAPYGVMRGAYIMERPDGETINVEIAPFQLIYPGMLN